MGGHEVLDLLSVKAIHIIAILFWVTCHAVVLSHLWWTPATWQQTSWRVLLLVVALCIASFLRL